MTTKQETKTHTQEAGFAVYGGGTLYVLMPLSEGGREWIDGHIAEDAICIGSGVAVEHRYIEDILQGIVDDGLTIEGENS